MSGNTTNKGLINATNRPIVQQCPSTRYWFVFISSSLITFAVGLVLLVAWKFVKWLKKTYIQDLRKMQANVAAEDVEYEAIGWLTEAKDWAGELLSGQRRIGRAVVSYLAYFHFKLIRLYYNYGYMWSDLDFFEAHPVHVFTSGPVRIVDHNF